MKKYRVVLSYAMALDFEVDASTEAEAEVLAQAKIDGLSDAEFVQKGEPQHMESSVEKINENNAKNSR